MRHEFSKKLQREIVERSGGVCEAGKFDTRELYGMAPDHDICHRAAVEIDHIVADGLAQRKPKYADEGLHVCDLHHKYKTHEHDRPKIGKAKRLRERDQGIRKRKGRPIPGSRDSGWRKPFYGQAERR